MGECPDLIEVMEPLGVLSVDIDGLMAMGEGLLVLVLPPKSHSSLMGVEEGGGNWKMGCWWCCWVDDADVVVVGTNGENGDGKGGEQVGCIISEGERRESGMKVEGGRLSKCIFAPEGGEGAAMRKKDVLVTI